MNNSYKFIIFAIIVWFIVWITMIVTAKSWGYEDFPSCANQTENGDIAHYDAGLHQIAGNGLLEGSDDVYSLGDGYFLQCFCSSEGQGIQTNWLKDEEGGTWGVQWN